MTEQKITVSFRPDQLADVIEAVNAYADDLKNDRALLYEMPRVDHETTDEKCRTKRYDGADLPAAHAADPAAVREGLPRPGAGMQRTLLQLDAL